MPKGKIKIKLQIEQNGAMNAEMLQGLGDPWDKIAMKIINTLYWWTPAYKNGRPVRSWQILQIHR
ncbi:MAG: hypothetical protein WCR52_16605 [Bacteroidota bacterium]